MCFMNGMFKIFLDNCGSSSKCCKHLPMRWSSAKFSTARKTPVNRKTIFEVHVEELKMFQLKFIYTIFHDIASSFN